MRCYICDKSLTEAEIQLTPDKKGFEPCSVCLEVAMDAAYSDGFVRPDEADEVPIIEDTEDYQQLSFLDGFGLSEHSPLE